jgi:hypothetical protein
VWIFLSLTALCMLPGCLITRLLTRLMLTLTDDTSPGHTCTLQAFEALTLLGPMLGLGLTAVVDSVANILRDPRDTPLPVRLAAVRLLSHLAKCGAVNVDFLSGCAVFAHTLCIQRTDDVGAVLARSSPYCAITAA